MAGGTKLKCQGPVDTYDNEKPDGVSGRVGFTYHVSGVASYHFMLEMDEVEKLRDELTGVLYQIAINRAAAKSKAQMERLTMSDQKIDRARRVASAAAEEANHARNDLRSAVSWLRDVDPEDDGRNSQEMRELTLKNAEDHAKKLLTAIAEARALIALQPS